MMSRSSVLLAGLLALALPFSASLAAEPPQPTHLIAGHAVYGEAMPTGQAPTPLGAALAAGGSEELQLISGRIGQVCQKKGCWMMLIDGDQAVRVMFGKDDFFIPMDSVGEAVVRGRLQQVEVSEGEARHLAEDGGAEADQAKAGVQWRIVAVSVLIKAEA